MNDQERLLQRFIDQDLSPEERLEFLEALNRDAALRQRLIEMERLVAGAARLPRLTPAGAFVSRVVARLEAPSHGLWARMRAFFFAPHLLEWNLAKAMAAACVVLVAAWWMSGAGLRTPWGGSAVQTVAASPTVYVRVALLHPEAESVTIAGDFNGWDPQGLPLRRAGDGLWTLTIPLKPGRYQYMYRVDGRWVTDPLASEFSPDGFGAENAVMDVREPTVREGQNL